MTLNNYLRVVHHKRPCSNCYWAAHTQLTAMTSLSPLPRGRNPYSCYWYCAYETLTCPQTPVRYLQDFIDAGQRLARRASYDLAQPCHQALKFASTGLAAGYCYYVAGFRSSSRGHSSFDAHSKRISNSGMNFALLQSESMMLHWWNQPLLAQLSTTFSAVIT